ncbi:unnamed protein product [Brassica rapa subsp. narinosa]
MKSVIFLCVNRIVCLIWSIDSHVTRSVSILGLSSGPLDLTEKSKWGNKVCHESYFLNLQGDFDLFFFFQICSSIFTRERIKEVSLDMKIKVLCSLHHHRLHTGKVDNTETSHEWCFISCSKSSWKLQRGLSSFVCGSYHDEKAVGIYRVEMAVSDASDSALFVAFDAEMNKLINGTSMEDAHNIAFPQCLRDILGRALTFQQKLSRFNFSSKHQSFTLIRASPSRFCRAGAPVNNGGPITHVMVEGKKQPLNLPKTMFAMVKLQITGA